MITAIAVESVAIVAFLAAVELMVAAETVALITLAVFRIDEIMASRGRRLPPADGSGS